jgi:L-ascorbate metabolism protein UlaG (beta-lactamase superfamily)
MRRPGRSPRNRGLAAAALLALPLVSACGHVIEARFAPNFGRPFDFRDPPCRPRPEPPAPPGPPGSGDSVLIRYLGAGGLYLRWAETSILTGPFFSNPGRARAAFGKLAPDAEAVRRGLAGIDAASVRGILVGHSHYDHLGDLPLVAGEHAASARLHVNRSGARMLAALPDLAARAAVLDERAVSWIWIEDAAGGRAPVRFMPVPSEHAPQIAGYRWADGEVGEPWTLPWTETRIRRFLAGTTYAFVIDLMSRDLAEVRFRIYYQDAASPAGAGIPPRFEGTDGHPYDLAVLCMASSHLAAGHPEGLAACLRPRHVLVTHYEDFLRSREKSLRFVPLLTDRRANAFLARLTGALEGAGTAAGGGPPAAGPLGSVCGPSGPGYTMPLPGEWMRFAVPDAPGAPVPAPLKAPAGPGV